MPHHGVAQLRGPSSQARRTAVGSRFRVRGSCAAGFALQRQAGLPWFNPSLEVRESAMLPKPPAGRAGVRLRTRRPPWHPGRSRRSRRNPVPAPLRLRQTGQWRIRIPRPADPPPTGATADATIRSAPGRRTPPPTGTTMPPTRPWPRRALVAGDGGFANRLQ